MTLLEKRAFMCEVFRFYTMHLLPLQLTVSQIVRFMLISGLFVFGNTLIYSAGDRPLDAAKVQCLWAIVTDPESATMQQVSTIPFGDGATATAGQVTNISSVWGQRNDGFVANADYAPISPNDPNNRRSYEDAADLARQARCSPVELALAAGHIFGENEPAPLSAVASHRNGQLLADASEHNSTQLPVDGNAEDHTNLARPLELPRDNDRGQSQYQEDSSDEGGAQFSTVESSDGEVTRHSKANDTRVVGEGSSTKRTVLPEPRRFRFKFRCRFLESAVVLCI
jgi:hypothetical protein